jgi:hypothetical protein
MLQWLPQVKHLLPTTPVVLIGCHCDLRESFQPSNSPNSPERTYSSPRRESEASLISEDEVQRAARAVDAVISLECSAISGTNLDLLIDTLVPVGYNHVQAELSQRSQRRSISRGSDGCIVC